MCVFAQEYQLYRMGIFLTLMELIDIFQISQLEVVGYRYYSQTCRHQPIFSWHLGVLATPLGFLPVCVTVTRSVSGRYFTDVTKHYDYCAIRRFKGLRDSLGKTGVMVACTPKVPLYLKRVSTALALPPSLIHWEREFPLS